MRRNMLRLVLPAALVAMVGACTPAPTPAPRVDAAAIGASVDSSTVAFMAAVAARDTDAVVAMYDSDAKLLPANAPAAVGHDAIRGVWAAFMRYPGLTLTGQSTSKVISEVGDLVVDVGAYQMKFDGPEGKPIEDVGKYVTVVRKVGGEWKLVVDTFNSDFAAPQAK